MVSKRSMKRELIARHNMHLPVRRHYRHYTYTARKMCPAAVAVPRTLASDLRSLGNGGKGLSRRHCMSTTRQINQELSSVQSKLRTEVRGSWGGRRNWARNVGTSASSKTVLVARKETESSREDIISPRGPLGIVVTCKERPARIHCLGSGYGCDYLRDLATSRASAASAGRGVSVLGAE